MASIINNDHYVPKFYLKRWVNKNGDLSKCRYINNINQFKWSEKHPSGICYERGLYGELEERFFKPLDNDAAQFTERLENQTIITKHRIDLNETDHKQWATFILGLIFRTPENVRFLESEYEKHGVPSQTAKNKIPQIIEQGSAIDDLRSMKWVFGESVSNYELITCDNPLIFKPRNLSDPECVIILPMTPKHFFIACRDEAGRKLPTNSRDMVKSINIEIIKNARKEVFARSRNSIKDRFINKHWKKNDT